MTRRKNIRKKKPQQAQNGAYKKYLRDTAEVVKLIGLKSNLMAFSNSEKHRLYQGRLILSNPVAENSLITPHELKRITDSVKREYRDKNIEFSGHLLSAYQYILLQNYIKEIEKIVNKLYPDENHPEATKYNILSSHFFKLAYSYLMLYYYKVMTQLSSPDYKYFGLKMRAASVYKENPSFSIIPELYGIPAEVKQIKVKGQNRPAYRLGKAIADGTIEWITIDNHILNQANLTQKNKLNVYIQSHALRRMKQRLDLLNKPAINYCLWENTNTISAFTRHRGYLLLPVKLYNCKVGYLLADVINNKLLFKTFLFITHNFTPEGDKLRLISGLGKEDITYWKIDRLSTFVNMDENKYPKLANLFKKAGLEDLFQLKEKDFDVDQMQTANLEGLRNYINKGQNIHKEQEKDFNALLQTT